ncbi:MAG: hypothetical protein ACR2P6_09880 [Gammaproteobacteria bacterium]
MSRYFLTAYIIGIALSLLGAHYYPLPDHARFRSRIETLPNGGREENFEIRIPSDRLGIPRYAGVAAFPQPAFAAESQDAITAELYRLRDSEGLVIGIASKITATAADSSGRAQSVSDWTLTVPARGALLLHQTNKPGLRAWSTVGTQVLSDGPRDDKRGEALKGTNEFSGLAGSYVESVQIDRVDKNGIAHGKIILSTRLLAESK